MLVTTGTATLKIDEDGGKYWKISDDSAKDSSVLDPQKPLIFSPDAFEVGTKIEIKEKASGDSN